MSKFILAAALAAILVTAAPFSPVLPPIAAAQDKQDAKQDSKKSETKKKAPSAALIAMRDRQKKCGAEWKEAKAAGKVAKGQTWPKYWSECNKRLKGKN